MSIITYRPFVTILFRQKNNFLELKRKITHFRCPFIKIIPYPTGNYIILSDIILTMSDFVDNYQKIHQKRK